MNGEGTEWIEVGVGKGQRARLGLCIKKKRNLALAVLACSEPAGEYDDCYAWLILGIFTIRSSSEAKVRLLSTRMRKHY